MGGAVREAKQMAEFRDCLNRCGLVDLGFIGQKYTWCNRRFGGERTKLRLDRAVANEGWMLRFPDARVFHSSMSISDHCLIKLSLKRDQNRRPQKKRFMFEAMWTREIPDAGKLWNHHGTLGGICLMLNWLIGWGIVRKG